MIPSLAPEFSAGHRAALASGKPLLYVVPPATWAVVPLFLQMGRGEDTTLVLAPVEGLTDELGAALARLPHQSVVIAAGLARTARMLEAHDAPTLVSTPQTARSLAGRSSLRASAVRRIVILWPELLHADARRAADDLLADAGEAQRIVVTADLDDTTEFVERYAHRAPLLHAVPAPARPTGRARVAITGQGQVPTAVRAALDIIDPPSTLLWDPSGTERWSGYQRDPTVRLVESDEPVQAALAIATDLPTPDVFDALVGLTDQVLILARPWQREYVGRLADPIKTIHLSAEVDRARDEASELRQEIERHIAERSTTQRLLALAPLFDRYDAAAIAAAALEATAGAGAQATTSEELPTWVHLRIDGGRRHGIRPGDIVGALLNAAGLPRDHVGRVDIHDSHALLQVRTPSARRAIDGLQGTQLRGRPLRVTPDRR